MERHEVDALLGLGADDVQEEVGVHVRDVAVEARDRLVDGDGAQRPVARVEHPLADGADVLADGEIHDEVRARLDGDGELVELVALAGVRDAPPEVRVDFRAEEPPDADGAGVLVVDVERDDGLAARDGGPHGLRIDPFVRRHDLHRLGHKALAGRLKLRHLSFPFLRGNCPVQVRRSFLSRTRTLRFSTRMLILYHISSSQGARIVRVDVEGFGPPTHSV